MSDVIAAQVAALDRLYRTHVAPGSRYALLDFPDHANVGDSAIWLGELAMLRSITGRDPDYVCCWHDFDADAFGQACPSGTVFLHGGGNLGDLWPHHQHFRETILAMLRDRAIVQLPQSIHFDDPAGAARFATVAAGHPDLTLYVRDHASLTIARAWIGDRAHLAPDSAFALGPQARARPEVAVLALLRGDAERAGVAVPPGATVVDWLDEDHTPEGDHEAQAGMRVERGLRLLSRGETVVTDRLHAHILALLLGIPHVALDNRYGKVGAYIDAWTGASPLVRRA